MKPEPSWDRWKPGFLNPPPMVLLNRQHIHSKRGLASSFAWHLLSVKDVAGWDRQASVFCLQSFGFGRHQDSAYPFQEHLDRCPEPAASWEPRHGALIHSPDSVIRTVDGFDSNPHTTACCSLALELRPPELDLEGLELSSKKWVA